MSRLANDVDTVGMALGQPVIQLFSSVVSITGTMIIMLSMCGWMTLTVLAMVPVTLLVTTKVARWSRKLCRRRQETLGEIWLHRGDGDGSRVVRYSAAKTRLRCVQ